MDQKTQALITRIAKEHAKAAAAKKFGFLQVQDLENEIWVIALQGLEEYDISRGPLENYLRIRVKTRLINRFKDLTKSIRSPCPRCPFYQKNETPDCGKFGEEKLLCQKWQNYELSVSSRNSLLNSSEPQVEKTTGEEVLNNAISAEVRQLIEGKIDKKFQRDLEQLLSGGKLSKQKLKKLKAAIMLILFPPEKFVGLTIEGKSNV